MSITHTFPCLIADDAAAAAAGEVLPSHWNDSHAIDGILSGDGTVRLALKNTNVDNVLNGDFTLTANAGYPNPISGRWNQTYGIGYNLSNTGGPLLANEPVLNLSFESFFEQGGNEYSEMHFVYTNAGNTESYRLESWALNRATDYIDRSTRIDGWTVNGSDGTTITNLVWNSGAGYGEWYFQACRVYARPNNAAIFHQRDAADSAYLALPYIDSSDRHVLRSFTAVGNMPGGSNPFVRIQPTALSSGNIVIDVPLPASTGSYAVLNVYGSLSGTLLCQFSNQNSSNSAAHVQFDLVGNGASGGDAFFSARNHVTSWSFGLDNSDGDKFKFSRNNGLGSNDALAIDTSNNALFYANLGIANAANGQACEIKTLTELLTIAAAATSTTTIQKPANSIILAVPVRVTTAVTCTSTFTVGDAGSATRFSTAAVAKAANTTDKGTAAGAYYNATAEGIVITPDTVPSDATGRVRVTIYYIELTPPTS